VSAKATLVEEIIARVAQEKGVALVRDDPLLEVVLLNQAIVERYMDEALQTIKQGMAGTLAATMRQARKDLSEQTQAQIAYVDEVMFQDREKFMEAQKEALEALRKQIKVRENWLTSLSAEIIKKVQAHANEEGERAAQKARVIRKKRQHGMLFGMFLGMLLTFVGVIGASWANAVWVCGR
jgi:hypothetical protein